MEVTIITRGESRGEISASMRCIFCWWDLGSRVSILGRLPASHPRDGEERMEEADKRGSQASHQLVFHIFCKGPKSCRIRVFESACLNDSSCHRHGWGWNPGIASMHFSLPSPSRRGSFHFFLPFFTIYFMLQIIWKWMEMARVETLRSHSSKLSIAQAIWRSTDAIYYTHAPLRTR